MRALALVAGGGFEGGHVLGSSNTNAEEVKKRPEYPIDHLVASADPAANKPKSTKQQVAGRLRQLKLLFKEGLLTDDFYDQKVAECETAR